MLVPLKLTSNVAQGLVSPEDGHFMDKLDAAVDQMIKGQRAVVSLFVSVFLFFSPDS